MATRTISPGAALLRGSRMFAIPAPLPKPTGDLGSVVTFNSDTATLPYPVHQTITTTPAARARGEWGLKRPLPLKSTTKSSTPLIRVDAIDTFEHVTHFASAADHTLTLRKWQETNISMSTPPLKDSALLGLGGAVKIGRGVFEENLNSTNAKDSMSSSEDGRWKFKGPWLAGQTDANFAFYLRTEVRKRSSEFMQYLRVKKAAEETSKAHKQAAQNGEEKPAAVKPSDISEEQMTEYLKVLRYERSVLFGIIREFLDLPPSPTNALDEESIFNTLGAAKPGSEPITINYADHLPKSSSPYANTGPPLSHPSAGLSYLRSHAYIYNHPVYGPQASPPPVQARVVQPKNAATGNFAPKLGVGGIVTHVPSYQDGFNTSTLKRHSRQGNQTLPGLLNIDPDVVGGAKVWIQPTSASIDTHGKINVLVTGAQNAAVAVHEGTLDNLPPELQRPMAPTEPLPRPSSSQLYSSGADVFGYKARAAENGRRPNGLKAKSVHDEAFEALQSALSSAQDEKPSGA